MKTITLLASFVIIFGVTTLKAEQVVNVASFSYSPSSFSVAVGEKITFNISENHNVKSQTVPIGAADFRSGDPNAVSSWEYTPTVAGVYEVYCEPHSGSMRATFTVTGVTESYSIKVGASTICGDGIGQLSYTVTGVTPTDKVLKFIISSPNVINVTPQNIFPTLVGNNFLRFKLPTPVREYLTEHTLTLFYGTTSTGEGAINGGATVTNRFNIVENVSITPNAQGFLCSGTGIALTSSVVNTSGAISYRWFKNNILTTITASDFQFTNPENGDQIKLEVQTATASQCSQAPITIVSNIYTASVIGSVLPTISVSGSYDYCNYVTTITSLINGGGVNPTIIWSIPEYNVPNGSNAVFTASGLAEINVAATMISTLSCANPKTVTSSAINISYVIYDCFAGASITTSGNNITLYNYINLDFATPFKLYRNNELIQTFTTLSVPITVSGEYYILYSTVCECNPETNVKSNTINFTYTPSSFTNGLLDDNIKVYPNPLKDKLIISTQNTATSGWILKLVDFEGKTLYTKDYETKTCKSGKGSACTCPGTAEIDVAHLPFGNYLLLISDGKKTIFSKKLVK